MKPFQCISAFILFTALSLHGSSQAPPFAWQKAIGGSASDRATSVVRMDDGNYLVCGMSQSLNGDMQNTVSLNSKGGYDFWVFKVSSAGTVIWRQVFGGTMNELAPVCKAMGNDKYVIAGTTHSQNTFDVTGSFGCFGSCNDCDDLWALCIDGTGVLLWKNTYGTNDFEQLRDITVTRSKNIAMLFYGYTMNCTPQAPPSESDAAGFWVIDSNGTLVSQPAVVYGDDPGSADQPSAICQSGTATDLTFAGSTVTGLSDTLHSNGGFDFWILSLNESLTGFRWQKNYGGSGMDAATSISPTSDGGYIVTGITRSDDGDVLGSHGATEGDIWVLKLGGTGALQWSRCYGGSGKDFGLRILQKDDDNYLLLAVTASDDGDISGRHGAQGSADYWIAELSDTGGIVWSRTLGGAADEGFFAQNGSVDPSLLQEFYSPRTGLMLDEASGDILIAGSTASSDGDVGGQHGSDDYWLVKMSNNPTGLQDAGGHDAEDVVLYPNPAQSEVKIIGAKGDEAFTVSDMLGRAVLPPMMSTKGNTRIDIRGLDVGTYVVRNLRNSVSLRLVKE